MPQNTISSLLLSAAIGLFTVGTFIWPNNLEAAPANISQIDPLSLGPLPLTQKERTESEKSLSYAVLYDDNACHLSLKNERLTYMDPTEIPMVEDLCEKGDKRIVYTPKHATLVACSAGQVVWTAKASIGSNGLGKKKEGDRKTPVGTYWLGYPRRSNLYGVFIPVGYPNKEEIRLRYTGSAIGIHGPLRFFSCHPGKALEKNWTAGCLAVARDEQILNISNWVLENWPVQLEVRAK